jgi:protein-S-isoprenylcysteine O-methyltransferase Ste14
MNKTRDTASVVAPPPLIALAAVVVGLVLDRFLPAYVLSVLLAFPARLAIAAVLFAVSAALAIPALLAFRAAGTHVEPWQPTSALVSGSIYRWLRNPMYVGLTLLLAGLSIALAGDWMLVMTAVFALVIHFGVVKREERYLEGKFGDAYRAYKAQVPRYGWPPA